jgi:hypothetical protein
MDNKNDLSDLLRRNEFLESVAGIPKILNSPPKAIAYK